MGASQTVPFLFMMGSPLYSPVNLEISFNASRPVSVAGLPSPRTSSRACGDPKMEYLLRSHGDLCADPCAFRQFYTGVPAPPPLHAVSNPLHVGGVPGLSRA